MKTKNNVQNTVLRTAAVVVSFVLISFTVAAQEFWKAILTNSSFNQIALAMVDTPKKNAAAESTSKQASKSAFYEQESYAMLNVEAWMIENDYFRIYENQQIENENVLQVEEWMLDTNVFFTEDETESPLKLESWMTDSRIWEN